MKKLLLGAVLVSVLMLGCAFQAKKNIAVISGADYEMDCYLPARWEKRLDGWDEWLLPPEGQRFVWVYCATKSIAAKPMELYQDDFQLSYIVEGATRHTTTLMAVGNNDLYMWAPEQDLVHGGLFNYGGVTEAEGFGDRYVFAVPANARDLVLEITSMPSLPLSVR